MSLDALFVGRFAIGTGSSGATASGTTSASGSTFAFLLIYGPTGSGAADPSGNPTDNKGNTYTPRGSLITTVNGDLAMQWYASENGAGGAGHTASINFVNANAFATGLLVEITSTTTFANVDIVVGDITQSAPGPLSVATGTLGDPNEVIVCGATSDTGSASGSGAITSSNLTTLNTLAISGTLWNHGLGKLVQSGSTASVSPNWTIDPGGSSHAAAISAITFKASTGGGAPDQPTDDPFVAFLESDAGAWHDESAFVEATANAQLVDFVAQSQVVEDPFWAFAEADGGVWLDETALIEATANTQLVNTAPPATQILDEAPALWGDGYEDPILEMVDFAPLQANAPPEDAPSEDAWPSFDEPDLDELFIDDYANEERDDPLGAEQWSDDEAPDEWWPALEYAPVGSDAAVAQPVEEAPFDAETDPDEWWHCLDAQLAGDVFPAIVEDAWPWDDPAEADDWWHGLDAPVADDAAPPEDAWLVEEQGDPDDWWHALDAQTGDDPLQDPPVADAWPWDDAAEGDEALLLADADNAAAVQTDFFTTPPDDAWPWDDPEGDDAGWAHLDYAPVCDDVVPPQDQPVADAWPWDDPEGDELAQSLDTDPVGDDAPPPPPQASGRTHSPDLRLREYLIETYTREWAKNERKETAPATSPVKLVPYPTLPARKTVKAYVRRAFRNEGTPPLATPPPISASPEPQEAKVSVDQMVYEVLHELRNMGSEQQEKQRILSVKLRREKDVQKIVEILVALGIIK